MTTSVIHQTTITVMCVHLNYVGATENSWLNMLDALNETQS